MPVDKSLLARAKAELDRELESYMGDWEKSLRARLEHDSDDKGNPLGSITFNARGEPCKRGETAAKTGCLPKTKGGGAGGAKGKAKTQAKDVEIAPDKSKSTRARGMQAQLEAVDRAHAAIQSMLSNPLDTDNLLDVVDSLMSLTKEGLKELRDRVGAKGGANKRDIAAKIIAALKREKASGEATDTKPAGDGGGSRQSAEEPEQAGGRVEEETGGSVDSEYGRERGDQGQSAGTEPDRSAGLASIDQVNKRIDKYAQFFGSKGQHEVAGWLAQLKDHINAVGVDAALEALGEAPEKREGSQDVQYFGHDAMEGSFIENYLNRAGISLTGDITSLGKERLVSTFTPYADEDWTKGRKRKKDIIAVQKTLKDKLEEAQNLPGLEASEDIGKLMGQEFGSRVDNFTPEVLKKLDETYGEGKWIVKSYGAEAYAGYGIFFPQRVKQLQNEAKEIIWQSGAELAKYGFSHLRDESGKIIGIKHEGGDEYVHGTEKYNETIGGEVRRITDGLMQDRIAKDGKGNDINVGSPASSEHGTSIPSGSFMAQPAFSVVGISNEERAAGITFKKGQEGRVHITTRDGKAEVVPHSTWLKEEHLPVVFESEETRAMAQAAVDAINALPESERQGHVYAPDVVKTADGYRVVEANPNEHNEGSGYLQDNPMIMDSYVSHVVGREPAHVKFIKDLLKGKGRGRGRRPEEGTQMGRQPAASASAGRGGSGKGGSRGVGSADPAAAPKIDPAKPEVGTSPEGTSEHFSAHGVRTIRAAKAERAGRWDHPQEVKDLHNKEVLQAAHKSGMFIPPESLSHITQSPNVGGQEHDVHEDAENNKFYKFTKGGHFGQNKDIQEYLKRHEIANQMWPALGYKFHGVTQSPLDGTPQAVMSMNRVEGTHPEQQEIHDWFTSHGWEPHGERSTDDSGADLGQWDWIDPNTGTVIGDAHGKNFIKTSGGLVPIDVDILPGKTRKPTTNTRRINPLSDLDFILDWEG